MQSDVRKFGRNVAFAASAQLVGQVLMLILTVALARRLAVSAYGIFVFGIAFPSWFLLLLSLGLDEVLSIDLAADHSRSGRYLTLVALLRLFLAALVMVALYFASLFVLADPFARTITMMLGASSVINAYTGTFTSVFRAFEQLEYTALVTIVERSTSVGVSLLLLFSGYGLFQVCLAFLAGSVASLSLSFVIVTRRFASFSRQVDARNLARILRKAAPFGLNSAVSTFTYTSGLVLLTVLRDSASTGLFNAAFTLLTALYSLLGIANFAVLPMMSRIAHESRERLVQVLRRIQSLSIIFGVPLALGGWFYADVIVTTIYGSAFRASADIFRILILGFIVETALLAGGAALAAIGQMKKVLYCMCAGAGVTIVLSIILIPPLGHIGAAYAFFASHFMVALLGFLVLRHHIGPFGTLEIVVKPLVAGFAMLIVLFAIPAFPLWAGVPIAGVAYFATLLGLHGTSKEDGRAFLKAIRGGLVRGVGHLPERRGFRDEENEA